MKKLFLAGVLLCCTSFCFSQYLQNFDTLVNTTGSSLYTVLPDGWGIYEIGSGSNADGKYGVGTGSSNTGNAYSFGLSSSSDRALGTVASGTNFPTLGVLFFNESDSVVRNLTISYTGEQWRYGGRTSGTKDTLRFEYSLDATGIVNNVGTWIRVKPLDFLSVNTSGTTAATLDGNNAINRQAITFTIIGVNLSPGASIVLRWSDFDITSNDDGLGIDDFSVSPRLVPGVLSSGGTNTGGGTGGGGGSTSNTSTSIPIFENKVATDSSFIHLYGNLHGHSTHSDGKASTGEPVNDYEFARTAFGMDFLGISEHNHSTAGLQIANYKKGSFQADTSNGKLNVAGQPFITLHGMEWGTISGGGHALVYGFKDSLINWEAGNNDIFVAKSDYIALFDKARNNKDAVVLLAHPNTNDFTGLAGGYKGIADSAVSSIAIESGPAFSTGSTYNDFPSSLAYINYYRNLLKQGYRVAAHMDQDNHELTFGKANGNRMVVLSKERTRDALLDGIRSMRVYASNDYNAAVNFTVDNYVIGSSILSGSNLTGIVTYTDAEGEGIGAVQVYSGRVKGADATLIHTSTTNTTFTIAPVAGETWYYYVIITQVDGNKIITAPIWVTGLSTLPIKLVDFTAAPINSTQVILKWNSASEVNGNFYIIEHSSNLRSFDSIGTLIMRGSGSVYNLTHNYPVKGTNYYRLKQVDKDGHVEYFKIASVNLNKQFSISLSPNPTRGILRISTSKVTNQKMLIQVIDIAGNLVYNKTSNNSSQNTIDVSNLPNGTYLLRVGDELSKFVISK